MPIATKPRRVPLLWILLPYALGIALARFLPMPSFPLLLPISIGGVVASYFCAQRTAALWLVLFSITLASVGAARFSNFQNSSEHSLQTIPREATLELKIETLFNATDPGTALGIASVINAPSQQTHLKNTRIFFFLDSNNLASYPHEGETFQTIGVIRRIQNYSEGDRFDAYLRNLGINLAYKQGSIFSKTQEAQGADAFFNYVRRHFSSILSRNKAPESDYTNALKGLMLGQKSELSPEQKQLFLSNGTMHLFAISGLHIGVIALCFHTSLSILRLNNLNRAITTIIAVTLFVLVTGGSASSWRALLMVACFYLASFSKKQNSPINALALSALIYLLISPGQLFQAGFQMSYLTVSAILLFGLPLAKTLNKFTPLYSNIPSGLLSPLQKIILASKNWILDATGVSIAAFLVSALLGIYYFQILPSYGVLINLVALPLASLAIVAGFLSLLFSPLVEALPVSEIFNNAAIVLIKLIHSLLELTSDLPHSSILTPAISASVATTAILSSLALISFCYSRSSSKALPLWQLLTLAFCTSWILYLQS